MNAEDGDGSFVFLRINLQIDIVHADDFAAVDVNHLLIQQVALQQEQSFRAIGSRPLPRRRRGADASVDGRDRREWQHPVAGLGLYDQRRDAGAVLLRCKCNLAHPSCRAGRVIHRGAQQFR
jgi:hypothetical protein